MMIDGIPNRPLYFYQKDIIDGESKPRNMEIYIIGIDI